MISGIWGTSARLPICCDQANSAERFSRTIQGVRVASGADSLGASDCAMASTCLASASSSHCNGRGFRIGLLPWRTSAQAAI